jgi:hypothetical protein
MSADFFPDFSAEARVWIYQADRPLQPEEIQDIEFQLLAFCKTWDSHGRPVKADAEIRDDLFIVLIAEQGVDNRGGCSMDRSVRLIQELGKKWDINFFNRLRLAVQSGNKWQLLDPPYPGFCSEALYHNNTITRKGDWINRILPVKGNWPQQFLQQ